MVVTRRTSTRLASITTNSTPSSSSSSSSSSSKKKTASSKRTHVSDSEPESETIFAAGPSKPAPKRFRGSATASSSKTGTSRARNDTRQESESTSESDTKSLNSYVNDVVDTPATTVSSESSFSTQNKGKGKADAAPSRRASTRLLVEVTDSQDENEDDESAGEPEDEGELSEEIYEDEEEEEEDEDEYDEEDEISISLRGKGKGKAIARPTSTPTGKGKGKGKAAFRISCVAPAPAATTDEGSDVDGLLEDLRDDTPAGLVSEDNDHVSMPAAPVRATPARRRQRAARQPRVWGGRRTREENTRYQLFLLHPELKTVWKELDAKPKIAVEKDKQPDGLSLTMLPFQLEGLHWLRCQEETGFKGGILADEMGMGKTIQTIGLLMSEPRAKPNLVVAPTVALVQWKNEIEKHTNNALSVIMYHGANREVDVEKLAEADVILTTYSVLESMYRKQTTGFKRKDGLYKEDSALHKVKFHRVILDEAHNIKDRSSKSAKAAFALQTKYKLCLSGTPLQNRIGELFSLLRFLEADPFSYYYCRNCPCKSLNWKFTANRGCDDCGHSPMQHLCFFNHELLKPIQNNGNEGPGKEAFAKLQILLKHIMLRRTKEERADDLGLPPKIVKVRRDFFNEEELDLYDSIYGDSKRQFNTYVAHGVVLNNYANIFTLITRMRQLADHPDLVLKRQAENGQNTLVCALCDDEAEDAIKSKCHHTFCRLCVQEYIDGFDGFDGEGNPDCPKCHIPLNIDLTQSAIEADYTVVKKNSIINRIDMSVWRSSTKIEALVEELYKLRSKNHTIKSIVFSQFTSMLQLVEWRLRKAGFKTAMLEGSMTPAQRGATISHFMENVETTVFLVSLKAGGVALNLIEASQVFIMDPWWNPSVEWQAADRIHRIGQTRACKVTRLVIEDSIESRILDLQEKKARMIHATVGGDQAAMDKLTPADMQFLFQN